MKLEHVWCAVVGASLLALVGAGVREYAIHNGRLTSDLNADQHSITNLPDSFWDGAADVARGIVSGIVPSWALSPDPPPSGVQEREVSTMIGAFSGTGTVSRASSVGDAEQWVDSNGYVWKIGERLADEFDDEIIYNTAVFARWEDDGGDDGDGVGWYMTIEDVGKYFVTTERDAEVLSVTVPYEDCRYLSYEITGDTVFSLTRGRVEYPYIFGKVALTNDVPSSPGDIGAAPASVADTVQAWQTYWDGDDVRVTVTNYYGSIDIPHLYIEQKMPADDTHDAAWFKTIWDEMTRWNSFLSSYADMTNHVENDLADRAWGVYDSSTGAYSPDGLLQVSQPEIQIAAGLAYQKTVTNGGELWVLTATEPMSVGGESTNGYFRITDGEGNPLFEIVKGDKRVVGATAGGIRVVGDEVQIDYMLTDNSSVEIRRTTDLRNGTWETVDATWTGTSGAYTAHVAKPTGPSAFFKASYEVGGETYIRHAAPAGIDRVYINGHTYSVSVETVNGKKLMVLTDD